VLEHLFIKAIVIKRQTKIALLKTKLSQKRVKSEVIKKL